MPSKLDQLQQQFRQRLDQQKTEKLSSIRIYNENQQKVLDRVNNRNSNGNLNDATPPTRSIGISCNTISPTTSNKDLRKPGCGVGGPTGGAGAGLNFSHPPGRKNGSGVDRSRPLKPMPLKPTVKNELQQNLETKEHHSQQQQQLNTLTKGSSSSSSSSSFGAPQSNNMVLGNQRTVVVRPPTTISASSRVSTSTTNSSSSSGGVGGMNSANGRQTKLNQQSTKVEVKKTGAGNKMIQTTTKPNEVVKVTVETIKKNTPANTVTTVKTTIHKRTILPAKSAPPIRNGSSSSPLTRKVNSAGGTSRTPSSGAGTKSARMAGPIDPNMAQCSICSRSFNNDRIEKHVDICQKTSLKKRKPFDVTKMRVKGTEAEEFVKRGFHKKEDTKAKKSNWRSQHETFIESIRQAKIVQKHLEAGGKLSDLPPPKPSENPDYVPCPHCGRKFNQGVAERHIPKCVNISSNKKIVKKK